MSFCCEVCEGLEEILFLIKMKKILVLFFAAFLIACTLAQDHDLVEESGPISITKNNIGNILKVDVDASAVVSSNVEASILQVLLAALNQQAALVESNN